MMAETEENRNSESLSKSNHSYYQGILLIIGNYRNMETFIPSQDKNKLFYDGRRLHDISSLDKQPPYSYKAFIDRSATIDTIWFNERDMPHSFFEVEHSTDIQNSLLKFNDLQDFHVRMTIVADIRRESEFTSKISYHAFDELHLNKRVSFMSYEALIKQYESGKAIHGFYPLK